MPSARGSREPQPLAATSGPGRRVRWAREPGDLPPTESRKPSWKGVAHMHKLLSGLVAGIALLAAAPAAMAASVAVRVEGTGDTLVPRTAVTTQAGSFTKDGNAAHQCPS